MSGAERREAAKEASRAAKAKAEEGGKDQTASRMETVYQEADTGSEVAEFQELVTGRVSERAAESL